MRLSAEHSLQNLLRKVAPALVLAYVVAIQLPLLSPYRQIPADEMQLVDAAYGVSVGQSLVPAGPFWSHTIPETGTFFTAYTPLYLYMQALALKLVGFSPLAIGLLHCALRLAAAAVFWLICRRLVNRVIGSLFVAAWATMAVGPVGRHEDLAVTFLLGSVLLLVEPRGLRHRLPLIGLLLGLTFLTYPSPVAVLPPLALVAVFYLPRKWASRETPTALLRAYAPIAMVGLLVCAAWLFWIVPYWHEFRVLFLEFALPDALAPSYWRSAADLVRYVVGGFLTSPIPFHYSLLPALALLGTLVLLDAKRNGFSIRTVVATLAPIAVAALTARARIHKTYNLVWLVATILLLLPILWAGVFTKQRRLGAQPIAVRVIVGVLVIAIGLQSFGHLALAGARLVGDLAAVHDCGANPHAGVLAQLPPGEKVVTNSALVFYTVRERNPVYWPSGLQGETPGRIPFSTTYDDSFRWLVLTSPLADDRVETVNPGGKFAWDARTVAYFRAHYTLVDTSDLTQGCGLLQGLSRFSGMARSLYLYQRSEGGTDAP